MPVVKFLPLNINIRTSKGKSILDLAFENDIVIEHNCGGLCACTSCRVIIKKGMPLLKKKSFGERELLEKAGYIEDGQRLSCMCVIEKETEDEILVEIPN